MKLPTRLAELVQGLDALGARPPLAALADLLKRVKLQFADVSAFVQPNSRHYQRTHVSRNAAYEVLVMTWLPGQASVPHDHTGSICAMQVIQGTAVESEFTIAADGQVDLEFENTIPEGHVTAGQDAGVHAIRNPSPDMTLVTMHVYAPPLSDFRRFFPRSQPTVSTPPPDTVVVIGGGFSGTMTAANLLRSNATKRVVLVERRGTVGEGLAYGTRDEAHRLNVPAGRMGAWADQPEHFLAWIRQRAPETQASEFLPRMVYGEYLRDVLRDAAETSESKLEIFLDDARRVTRHPDGGWLVNLGRGAALRARAVVLAIGHRPPNDPLQTTWEGPRERFLADPWKPFTLNIIDPSDSVAILGSGLTAVDTVLSLTRSPRTAPITLLSRSGLMPHAHSRTPHAPTELRTWLDTTLQQASKISILARSLRQLLRSDESADWRCVVDGLRPHTARVWQHLPIHERRKFLTRLRPFWEIHRHRMAPDIADRMAELISDGDLEVAPGTIVRALGASDRVILDFRPCGSRIVQTRAFAWVINCTGPAPSNSAEANPVVGSLLVHDWLSRDELNLGLRTTAEGCAISATGNVVPDLFVVGTLRKPEVWESTAVPELRQQAAHTATRLARHTYNQSEIST